MNNKEKGFSLIEVIAAMTIMIIGILSVVSLVNSNIKTSREAKHRLVALNLAQEGLELTRNYRDSIWKQGSRMKDVSAFQSGGTYVIDPKDGRLLSGRSSQLYQDPNSKVIQHNTGGFSSGNQLPYSRQIIISDISPGSVTVTSLVTWETKEVKLVEVLYDWKP